MLERAALIFVVVIAAATAARAQAPAETPADTPANPLNSRAVMTGEQVIRILDETVDWYRLLGLQQQSATQPSDLLILYANRQAADRVVALAFEIARANAELLSSQAEVQQAEPTTDPAATPQALQRNQRELEARRAAIRAQIAAVQQRIAAAPTAERDELQANAAELQSELDLVNARRNLLSTMEEFAHDTDANGSGVSTLKEHINAIAASIPAATLGVAAADAGMTDGAMGTATSAAVPEQNAASRFGIWDLGSNVLRLGGKLATIDEVDRRTEALQQTFAQIRAMPEQQIRALSARGDELGAQAGAGSASLKTARDEYDTLAWLFRQTSSILVPLAKAGVLLDQYRNNLDSWRDAARSQYRSALQTLGARLGLLLVMLAVVFGASELWRRAVFKYVQETRRRHQLLLVRRIVVWAIAIGIVGVAFATEADSFATFAGLLTAGVAVAMQSVLVSIVGYFFLVGKYGLRVGDRVQVGAVTGEVIDLGLVRLHLMELGPLYRPTGRVVAFANSIVFQTSGGIFKQIPGVNLAWREMTLAVPDAGDYMAVKETLLAAAERVLGDYRDELARQTHELRKAASNAPEEARAHVQLKFTAGAVEAIVRYPVPFQRAAEVEERMSRALLEAVRESAGLAKLTEQPA